MYRSTAGQPFLMHLWTDTEKDTWHNTWKMLITLDFWFVQQAFLIILQLILCVNYKEKCVMNIFCLPSCNRPLKSLHIRSFQDLCFMLYVRLRSFSKTWISRPYLESPGWSIDCYWQQWRSQVPLSSHLYLSSVHIHLQIQRDFPLLLFWGVGSYYSQIEMLKIKSFI